MNLPDGAYDPPVVSVWQRTSTVWVKVGEVGAYQTITFTPTVNDPGSWSLSMDFTEQATLLTDTARLVTIDWRDVRSTWQIVPDPSADEETGDVTYQVAGVGALSRLGWELAWPDPTKVLGSQPVISEADPPIYKGPAEGVITNIIRGNLVDRRGMQLTIPTAQGRGLTVSSRPQFDNVLELVIKLAKVGGVIVDLGLVNVGGPESTKANLTLLIREPVDRTRSILLTPEAGTIDAWEQTETEPTATKAIVAGAGGTISAADRVLQVVSTPESEAAATAWGGHRVVFVDGPPSFDPEELTQAGREAILEGAATRTLSLTSAETAGQLAFYDFNVGDKATAAVVTGAAVQDAITSIEVTVDTDSEGGTDVKATFGDPSKTDADLDLVDQIGALKQAVRRQEKK